MLTSRFIRNLTASFMTSSFFSIFIQPSAVHSYQLCQSGGSIQGGFDFITMEAAIAGPLITNALEHFPGKESVVAFIGCSKLLDVLIDAVKASNKIGKTTLRLIANFGDLHGSQT